MPIYRCNRCGFVSDTTSTPIGSKTNCDRCETACTVFDTVYYVEKLAERYLSAIRELQALKAPEDADEPTGATGSPPTPAHFQLSDIDTLNSSVLANVEQHAPLKAWFKARQIEANFDYAAVDTSGFFDDAARQIGLQHGLFGELIDRIRYAYRNSHSYVNVEVANLSQKDAQALNKLCRQLYDHTFFARYHYQKPEKIIRLTLQPASTIRQFFDGGWVEWFAFIEVVEQLKQKKLAFSCARGIKVEFPNEDLHELDVMVLVDGQAPICIECKSGEFRRDIDKYLRLRKRLGLDRNRFMICVSNLSDEQATGLSTMYELTFVNLDSLGKKLMALL